MLTFTNFTKKTEHELCMKRGEIKSLESAALNYLERSTTCLTVFKMR